MEKIGVFVSAIRRQRLVTMGGGTGRGEGASYKLGFIGPCGPTRIVGVYQRNNCNIIWAAVGAP